MTEPIRVLDLTAATGGSAAAVEDAADIQALPAEGAVDALNRLDVEPVDCVIVGTDRPGMAVDEFLRAAREASPSLPAVIVDADGTPAASRALAGRHTRCAADRSAVPDRVREVVAERRAERASDRHAELERLFRAITRASLGEASPGAVVRAAHDHLTASGCYRFVWVGTYDGGNGELNLRAPFEGSFDPAEVTAEVAGGRPGFVERAVREGEITTTDGPATTRSAAGVSPDSGSTAESMTTAAVPLRRGDEKHGVIVLVSDRPHAFDEAERAILSDLGDVVAHAMATGGEADAASGTVHNREFATALAHEVRNPIGLAGTYLDLALEDGDRADIEQAAAALERAESIVDDLLSIAGRDTVTDTTDGPMAPDAEAAWDALEAPDAELVIESAPRVEADHDLVVRLLANLFENAIEHAGEDATVTLGRLEGGFYVADDGPGIPPEERDAVFEWGYADGDGAGIGLGLVREIADAHGWAASVTEAEGGGARFEIAGATSEA